jgi:hypothetical protein
MSTEDNRGEGPSVTLALTGKPRLLLVATVLLVVMLSQELPAISAASLQPKRRATVVYPKNVILFYDDYPIRGDPNFQITQAIARPLVVYLDSSGNPKDWMFDTIILYNLWLNFEYNPTTDVINQWTNYIFRQGQIANLDLTVAEAKEALKRPSYSMNVVLTVPVAYDAINEVSIEKNVDNLISGWNKLSPTNLNLMGFYWGFTENLDDYSYYRDLHNIVPNVAAYIHAKNMKLFMIPNPQHHLDRLGSAGIDFLTLQPNYHIDANSDLTDFATVDQAIKSGYVYGVHFEIPFSDNPILCCSTSWQTNLQTYFNQAYAYGWYTNRVTTYYHGAVISQLGRINNADYRAAYDTIYQYIQKTLEVS